jgi:hypothetical protein
MEKRNQLKLVVSSVLREIEDEKQGGLLGIYNWDTLELEWVSKSIFPLPYCARCSNPRGGRPANRRTNSISSISR